MDGVISSQGGNATGDDSGGASAGSVYIKSVNFSGHGLVTAEGGNGISQGYGGSGGRVSAHVTWNFEYNGDLTTYGGLGGVNGTDESTHGSSGTVYFTGNEHGLASRELVNTTEGLVYLDSFRKLKIDNDNRNKHLPTMIMSDEKDNDIFEFDVLEANNHAVLQIWGHRSELIVHDFEGDRTGLMYLSGKQICHVEYVESKAGFSVAPVSFYVSNGTELRLPSTVIMLGTRSELGGLLTNVQNLTIAEGANVVFYSTSQTALIEDGSFTHLTTPGNISFSLLKIQRGSEVTCTETESDLSITIVKFLIQYEGLLSMNTGTIYSEIGVIESKGRLVLDSMGHGSEYGPGHGSTNGSIGYGAAHGGHGGAPRPHQVCVCLSFVQK